MIAVMVSGGKDSTVTLLLAVEKHGKENVIGIFTDTGWEAQETYEYIDYLEKKVGTKIYRLKNKKFDGIPDIIRKKKRFPSSLHRFCTPHLKIVPVAEFLAFTDLPISEVWFGIRLSESESRNRRYSRYSENRTYEYAEFLEPFKEVKREIKERVKEKRIGLKFPILTWEEEDVFRFLEEKRIKPNPLYEKGFKRVGCFPCILAGLHEWKLAWKTKQGRKNIELLFEIEEELNKQGYNTRIKDKYTRQELRRILELNEAQLELFGDTCSICRM